MSFRLFLPTGLLALAITFAGCGSALYKPTPENTPPGSSLAELQAGRKLYVGKCGGCHNLILPEKYTAGQWQLWVDSMEVRSKISPEEKELINKYLKR